MESFDVFTIIVAGGSGVRMQSPVKKQYLALKGKPVLYHTLKAFSRVEEAGQIVLAVPLEDIGFCRNTLVASLDSKREIRVVSGGKSRQESVANGLAEAAANCRDAGTTVVLIHDGVRPFADPALVKRCIQGAVNHGACVPGIHSVDTLKEVGAAGGVAKTLDRHRVYRIQTPQAFRLDLILHAFDTADRDGFSGTDDASVAEYAGFRVHVTEGSERNLKITTKEDMALAEIFLSH